MHQTLAAGVACLLENGKYRAHGKISVQYKQTPFANRRYQTGGHGRHQRGDTDFGHGVDNRWRLVLELPDGFYPFMQFCTKGDAKGFF
jgi:hypothetical protein